MPLQSSVAVENNFKNGLITTATGLNFPENACIDTSNCDFHFNGSVSRRLGFDFEDDFVVANINRTNRVVASYLWKNVSGASDLSLLVLQVGSTLNFYEIDGSTSTSNGIIASTVTLSAIASAPSPSTVEAQFANGDGVLFVTHPYCRPFYVTYDVATQTATRVQMTIQIRDFEGDTADALDIDERPTASRTTITDAHLYNLYNQGWRLTELNTWDAAQTYMPSNSDVQWRFADSGGDFNAGTGAIARVIQGNSLAPKGHYILDMATATNRNTLATAQDGTSVTAVTESGFALYRPSTCAFFAGRIWYSGVATQPYNNQIFFSQIIQRREQYARCYQQNDPTSEEAFDLLPDDGGVVKIPEAGSIIKLFAIVGGMVVFAERGVWLITGSSGIGFTANDYTVQKLSSITTLSASSFVDVLGNPCWWTAEGIYMITSGEGGAPSVKSLTFEKIKQYYDAIPLTAKSAAKGAFNYNTSSVQWIFKSEMVGDLDEDYAYDRILNLNLATGAFYPWDIPESDVTVNGILLLDGAAALVTQVEVTNDTADNIVDDSANNVISFASSNTGVVPQLTYIVSYASGSSYRFTFASARATNYLDWFSYDEVGTEYTSYFISGYKLRGQAIRKWQANWLRIFSENSESTQFYVSGIWDYANNTGSNRWSTPQLITNDNVNYTNLSKRVKIRGHGLTLQFLVESVASVPFSIIGWSELDTGNSAP